MSEDGELNLVKIFEEYGDMLFRIAYSTLNSKEDAEDAVQDVFEKYINKGPTFKSKDHEKAWLIRVTVNHCYDLHRKNKVRFYTPIEDMIHISGIEDNTYSLLKDVLNLPLNYRTVLTMHYFEGFKVEEIAKILKLSKSAVKMRLLRGRELLKKELQEGDKDV